MSPQRERMETNDFSAIEPLIAVLKIVLEEKRTISVATLQTFLGIVISQQKIAAGESVEQKALSAQLGVDYGAVARQLDLLSDGTGPAEGMGLVNRQLDPRNRKQRHNRLTDEGMDLARRINSLMQAHEA